MNIWYINPYNPIPGEAWRESRTYMACEALSQAQHLVIWWTANFSHHFKKFRSKNWEDRCVNENFIIRLTPTAGYSKNTSIQRIWFETLFAWQVYRRAMKESPPDCIICPDTILPVTVLVASLTRRFNAWLVLDIYDLWPELFVLVLPRFLRPLAPIIFSPFYIGKHYIHNRADAIVALSSYYLQVALRRTPHLRDVPNAVVFNGIDVSKFRSLSLDSGEKVALAQKRGKEPGEIWGIYAGSLGNNYDIPTILQAAKLLEQRKTDSKIKILIAGDGVLRSHVIRYIKTHHLGNLAYLGVLRHEELIMLYQICDFGLCPYAPESNVAMPDKVYDYMAAGLPIVNSLRGELENLLYEYRIGIQYIAGDPNSLVDAIEWMAVNEEQRQIMARNSYNVAMQFDRHVQYQKFVDLIEKLLQDDSQAICVT